MSSFHNQANYILSLAKAAPKADSGNDRVFLVDLYDHMKAVNPNFSLTLEQVKAFCRILAKHGLIRLTRCDLVGAYDANKVAMSSCMRMGAEFHFIVV